MVSDVSVFEMEDFAAWTYLMQKSHRVDSCTCNPEEVGFKENALWCVCEKGVISGLIFEFCQVPIVIMVADLKAVRGDIIGRNTILFGDRFDLISGGVAILPAGRDACN